MKNLLLLLAVSSLFSCTSGIVKEEETVEIIPVASSLDKNSSVYDVMFNDLMLLSEGGMYRGVDFDMDMAQVRKIEKIRSTTSELDSEKENELIITSDLGEEILDFADIKYTFDENGLYFISAESYLITEEKAKKLYGMINDFLTEKYGEGVLEDDGFLDFKTSNDQYDYQISIKEINYPATENEDGSYGFYLVYSMQGE